MANRELTSPYVPPESLTISNSEIDTAINNGTSIVSKLDVN